MSVSERESRVLDRIDLDRVVALTEDLVGAAAAEPEREQKTVDVLAAALHAIGADVELVEVAPGRPNLVAHLGGDRTGGGVLFLGHSDVVPAGTGWTGDPFEARRAGDHLVGRGTADMKGGLAAVVAAMAAVHAEAPDVAMSLICTVDEEADARGARHHIATAPRTPYRLCVVAEPTRMVTITGCRGATNLRVELAGAAAHAGKPDEGASAISAAACVIAAVEGDAARLARAPHPVLGAATWNVGTIGGGHGTSIVPDACSVGIDRRTLPGEEPADVLAALLDDVRARIRESAWPGTNRIEVSGTVEMTMPGFVTDPADPVVDTVRACVRDVGGSGAVDVWTASCEGGFIAAHHDVPTVVLGPGDITDQAHKADECVPVTELHTAARAFALIALRG